MSALPKNTFGTSAPEPSSGSPGYETDDAQPHLIGVVAAVVAGGILLSLLAAAWLYHVRYRDVAGQSRQTPFTDGATYRTSVAHEWTVLDQEYADRLHEYAWVDRQKGVVRIPIDQAMSLIVTEATRPSVASSKPKPTP